MVQANQPKASSRTTGNDATTRSNPGSNVSSGVKPSARPHKSIQNHDVSESRHSVLTTVSNHSVYHVTEDKANGMKGAQTTRIPLARIRNASDSEPYLATRLDRDEQTVTELVLINQDEHALAASLAAMRVSSATTSPQDPCQASFSLPTAESYDLPDMNSASLVDPYETKSGYVSLFLHCFAERTIPSSLGISMDGLEDWAREVLYIVSDPSSEQAKRLLKVNPQAVLFAQQLHLCNQWSDYIEAIAQRAATRDYYYDFLIRIYGPTRAHQWISGREEGDERRRRCARKGSLSMRKRVLIGQGNKAYYESVERQAYTGTNIA